MNILKGKLGLRKLNILDATYPKWEIALVAVLLYLAPFTSSLLTYAAFALCAYRIVAYDARVFVTDYALLLPMSQLFRANGMSLLIYVCLIASVWYFVSGKLEKQYSYAILLILLNYLVLRMQWNISGLVLCFGQLFMLCVMLPKQDEASAERAIKMFCLSLLVSSMYAFVLRNTWQIAAVRGDEVAAFWGSSLRRFQGLFEDPNYYMTLLVTAMALLLRLFDCKKIEIIPFVLLEIIFTVFGALTYGKTFFILLLLLAFFGIVCLFMNKKYLLGSIFILISLVAAWVLLSGNTIFSVVLQRFSTADSLDALTTGRSEVYAKYIDAITKNFSSLVFGAGFAAKNLGKDPHNLYLEIVYYLGITGLLLMIALCVAFVLAMRKRTGASKQNWLAKNLTIIMAVIMHFTLHGIFSMISYAVFFFAFLSILLVKREET